MEKNLLKDERKISEITDIRDALDVDYALAAYFANEYNYPDIYTELEDKYKITVDDVIDIAIERDDLETFIRLTEPDKHITKKVLLKESKTILDHIITSSSSPNEVFISASNLENIPARDRMMRYINDNYRVSNLLTDMYFL